MLHFRSIDEQYNMFALYPLQSGVVSLPPGRYKCLYNSFNIMPGSSPIARAIKNSSSARNWAFGLMLNWLNLKVLIPVFLATSALLTDFFAR